MQFQQRPHWADCVEKLRHSKIVSKNWNKFPLDRILENAVCKAPLSQNDVLPIRPFSAEHRVFQHNRLAAVIRRAWSECPLLHDASLIKADASRYTKLAFSEWSTSGVAKQATQKDLDALDDAAVVATKTINPKVI